MNGTIQSRLMALEAALRPTRSCWIAAIQAGESAEQALQRHAKDPALAEHAFMLLPMKRSEVPQ